MALLGETTGNLRTYPAATKTKGIVTQGTPVLSTFTATWRPVTGSDLQKLPEKSRVSAKYKIYSETDFDWQTIRYEFEFDSLWWEILGEEKRNIHGFLQHNVYFLKRIENV